MRYLLPFIVAGSLSPRIERLHAGAPAKVVSASPAVARKPPATLAEIAAALRTWRRQIHSIRVSSELNNDESTQWSKQQRRDSLPADVLKNWIWTEAGQRREYWRYTTNSGQVSDLLTTYDGRFKFEFPSPGGDPPKDPDSVRITTDGLKRVLVQLFPPHFVCEFVEDAETGVPHGLALDELIDRGRVRRAGTEAFQGRRLPVLEFLRPQETLVRITVDPAYGYLTRKFEIDRGKGNGLEVHINDEFRRVSPPGIWFPVKGRSEYWLKGRLHDRQFWRVHTVKLNEDLDDSLFHPVVPGGTRVLDYTTGRQFSAIRPHPEEEQHPLEWLAWTVVLLAAAATAALCVRSWRRLG